MKKILVVENEAVDERLFVYDMDLRNGKYLKHDILAVSGDWLIVYDGEYNYLLFSVGSTGCNRVLWRYKKGWLPSNDVSRGSKEVEYYSSFDNALYGLAKIIRNNGKFVTSTRYFRE